MSYMKRKGDEETLKGGGKEEMGKIRGKRRREKIIGKLEMAMGGYGRERGG
jgi:hypothetical protein